MLFQANDGAKVSSVNETEKNISLSETRDDEPEFKNGETNLMGKAYTKKGVEVLIELINDKLN